ncbi:MAG: lactate racemase domain-containing protein [Thermoanaerobaculales bacterium]|nr:lactate racemase domain-containing protein [Thermoanaerobaculales bacterium]
MIVRLPFGREGLALDLRGFRVHNLRPEGKRGVRSVADLIEKAVDRPLDGLPLVDQARGRRSAVVVVPDATRSVDLPGILPPVLSRLARAGIPSSRQRILVACGTHPPISEEELSALVGPLPDGVTILQHDARDTEVLVAAGALGTGLPIRLHRWVMETDFLVTLSSVRHHYFAGFGGGPKMIFPGVAGYEEIQTNHSRVLEITEKRIRRHRACEPGILKANPVAEEIAEAADRRPPDMVLCLVPGVDGGFSEAFAGPWRSSWDAAVEQVRTTFEVPAAEFDMVVGSGGGRPSDETLIQAHKGLDAACRFVRPHGEVAFVASLQGGLGSVEMEAFVEDPRPEVILNRLARGWIQYGHTTLRIIEKTSQFRIRLVSHASPSIVRRMGFEPENSLEEMLKAWRTDREGATVGVLPGPAVYPRIVS